jgi:hypothetical protein
MVAVLLRLGIAAALIGGRGSGRLGAFVNA